MAASTSLIADTKTVITNGPSSVSSANAIAAGGPIMDYPGNTASLLLKLQQVQQLLTKVISVTVTGDGNYAGLAAALAALNGTSSPAAHAIANLQTAFNTPASTSAQTLANAIAPGGPIIDYFGAIKSCERGLQDASFALGGELVTAGVGSILKGLIDITDATSDGTNRNLLIGISQTLT